MNLELLVQVGLELLSVFEGVKSVLEDSQDLMSPQLNDVLLAFVEVLICKVYSLEYLGDVSHVEDVVRLGWSWQEVLLDDVEEVDG